MAGNNANVSSNALTELQSDLRTLSSKLHELYDTMNADMSNITEFWQDQKYQDFVSGYRPQINKCEEISQRYNKWCSSVLQEAIDKVVEIEMANVSMDGGSVSSASGSAAAATVGAATAASAKSSKASEFNTGTKPSGNKRQVVERFKTKPSKGQPKKVNQVEQQPTKDTKLSYAEETAQDVNKAAAAMCASDPKAKAKIRVENNYEGDNLKAGGKLEASGKVLKGVVNLGGQVEGEYNSGKKSSNVVIERTIDCNEFNA